MPFLAPLVGFALFCALREDPFMLLLSHNPNPIGAGMLSQFPHPPRFLQGYGGVGVGVGPTVLVGSGKQPRDSAGCN